MKSFVAAAAVLAGGASAACVQDPVDNYYCNKVTAITYTDVGGQGSYNQITNMDDTTGACTSAPLAFSGPLSPLNEQISMHFRGPLQLKSFNVYIPDNNNSTAPTRRSEHIHRHAHARRGHGHAAHGARAVGDEVIATIDGQVVSWVNEYTGQPTPAPAAAPAAAAPAAAIAAVDNAVAAVAAPAAYNSNYTGDGWPRVAFYDAESGTAGGLSFLNHMGGANGSGVFDYTFGNSLAYAAADGKDGSPSPAILADTLLDDETEVIIMSDVDCDAASCGYSRDGTVAKQGWNGPEKAFLMEFSMPDSGIYTSDPYSPKNMPAIWALNAQIPRTMQYGQADCSCWTSGCGEFDIMEVLYPGYDKAKSTLHGLKAGGDSDWLARPFTGTMKLAVLMMNNAFHIQVLDAGEEFGNGLSQDQINKIATSSSTAGPNVSLFSLLDALKG